MVHETQVKAAVALLEKEREDIDNGLEERGWVKHVDRALREDTGIRLVVFSRRSDPEWFYRSQGGAFDFPTIDYDEDDLTWTIRTTDASEDACGTGAFTLLLTVDELDAKGWKDAD